MGPDGGGDEAEGDGGTVGFVVGVGHCGSEF